MPPAPGLSSEFFFFNDTATTEIYTLSLHDALPILLKANTRPRMNKPVFGNGQCLTGITHLPKTTPSRRRSVLQTIHSLCKDRKSTRLNSSHSQISYAVFCLKKRITAFFIATAVQDL